MLDVETRYFRKEYTALALKNVSQKLYLYFQAHQVTILTNQPLRVTLHKLDLSGWLLKWAIELSEYRIKYQPKLLLKGQVIVDFIAELPKEKKTHLANHPGKQWWTLHVDGASKVSRSGVGLILQSPTRELMEQAIRLSFFASNNEVEYDVLVELDLALVLAATKLEIRSDSLLIVEHIQQEYEAKDEHMTRYLAMVESHLKKLDKWVIRRVPVRRMGRQTH